MIYLLISIGIITLLFFSLQKNGIVDICPICAGVVGTWVIGLIGIYTNIPSVDPMFVGLLMAGTIGAVAEKYGGKKGLLWKSGLIVLGFTAIYYLVNKQLMLGVPLGLATFVLGLSILKKNPKKTKEDMFKECC